MSVSQSDRFSHMVQTTWMHLSRECPWRMKRRWTSMLWYQRQLESWVMRSLKVKEDQKICVEEVCRRSWRFCKPSDWFREISMLSVPSSRQLRVIWISSRPRPQLSLSHYLTNSVRKQRAHYFLWGRTFSLVQVFCHVVSNESQTFFPLRHIHDALVKETWQCIPQCNKVCYSVPRPFLFQVKGLARETKWILYRAMFYTSYNTQNLICWAISIFCSRLVSSVSSRTWWL